MAEYELNFSIKRLEKATECDFIKSLKIYSDTTPTEIKTEMNEIIYWAEKKNRLRKSISFNPVYFCLYLNGEIVGFSMLSYLNNVKTAVIEYLALVNEYRNNSVFFPFLNLLMDYMRKNNFDVEYYINEISNKNNGISIDKESKLFHKMICMEGFGKIEAKYITLPLGVANFESSFDAFLYIKGKDNINNITTTTYLSIIRSLYFDYYLEWYKPFLNAHDFDKYNSDTQKIFLEIEKSIEKKDVCLVKETSFNCPLTSHCQYNTAGTIEGRKKRNIFLISILIILIFILPIFIIFTYNFVLKKLGIEINSVNSAIGSIFSAVLSIFVSAFIIRKNK